MNVAGLVPEDGLDFLVVKVLKQCIRDQNVAHRRDEAHDGGVDRSAMCLPQENLAVTQSDAPAGLDKAASQRAVRQGARGPDVADQHGRTEKDEKRRDAEQGVGGIGVQLDWQPGPKQRRRLERSVGLNRLEQFREMLHKDDQDHRRGDHEYLMTTFIEKIRAEGDVRLGSVRARIIGHVGLAQGNVANRTLDWEKNNPLEQHRGEERREHDQFVGQRPAVQAQRPAYKTRPRCRQEQGAKQDPVKEGEAEHRVREPRGADFGVSGIRMHRGIQPTPRGERRAERKHDAGHGGEDCRQGVGKRSTPFEELKLCDREIAAKDQGEREND
ncbi:MAG: hypothetical protein HBSAPP02_24490 [Phycisphaerae bacterium]|nr:MAG: hypothetical protein HBSAPP02_24490 [Phycisphaerae bacterium]